LGVIFLGEKGPARLGLVLVLTIPVKGLPHTIGMQVAMQWDDNGIIQLGCIWGYSRAIQHSYGFLMAYFVR